MSFDLLKVLGENQISATRPAGCIIASCSLAVAGGMAVAASVPVMLACLFASVEAMIIPAMVFAFAGLAFPIVCGLYRGYLWAWYGAMLVSIPLFALSFWVEVNAASRWSEAMLLLLVCNQILLWWSDVRAWFQVSHQLRVHGYKDAKLPGGQKIVTPEA